MNIVAAAVISQALPIQASDTQTSLPPQSSEGGTNISTRATYRDNLGTAFRSAQPRRRDRSESR